MLKEEYDRDNRVFTKREMGKFRIMRSEVTIDEFGFRSKNPPSYLFDTENVFKINKKHNFSVYNSDLHFHERSEVDVFPHNLLQKYRLIDVKDAANMINPLTKDRLETIMSSRDKKPEPAIIEFDLANTNKKPPLKQFNAITATTLIEQKAFKPSNMSKSTCATIEERMTITNPVDECKKDLVVLLEKSNFIAETTKANKLNYFYKKSTKSVKTSSHLNYSQQILTSDPCLSSNGLKSPISKTNRVGIIHTSKTQCKPNSQKFDSYFLKEFQSPTSYLKTSTAIECANSKLYSAVNSSRYISKN